MGSLTGLVFGAIVATVAWFIAGYLDLSWIAGFFGNLF